MLVSDLTCGIQSFNHLHKSCQVDEPLHRAGEVYLGQREGIKYSTSVT